MLSQYKIYSPYAQHILNDDFEIVCDFFLCRACKKIGNSLSEHAQKLIARWLSMRKNWLLAS
jgi:hypothetical protein